MNRGGAAVCVCVCVWLPADEAVIFKTGLRQCSIATAQKANQEFFFFLVGPYAADCG